MLACTRLYDAILDAEHHTEQETANMVLRDRTLKGHPFAPLLF